MSESLLFFGEPFTMADRIGAMALMRFAKVAQSGADSDDLAGLTAMYDLLEQCIAPQDWQRFQAAADTNRADGEQLMAVVAEVVKRLSERPTSRPSVSSDGPHRTAPNSRGDSFSRVMDRYQGRPDIQLMVLDAQTA